MSLTPLSQYSSKFRNDDRDNWEQSGALLDVFTYIRASSFGTRTIYARLYLRVMKFYVIWVSYQSHSHEPCFISRLLHFIVKEIFLFDFDSI